MSYEDKRESQVLSSTPVGNESRRTRMAGSRKINVISGVVSAFSFSGVPVISACPGRIGEFSIGSVPYNLFRLR